MPVVAVIIWDEADKAHRFIPEDPFIVSFQFVVRPDHLYYGAELKYRGWGAQCDNELWLHDGNGVLIPFTTL